MTESRDLDQLKILAAHVSEVAVEGRRQLLEEHSASFKWLMASFLALNGAGLIGLKDLELSDSTGALIAGASFFLGIVCALLIAYLGQKSNQRMIDPISQSALYWRGVAATGEIDEKRQKELDQNIDDAIKGAKWPSRAGFGSLLFFAAGLITIAVNWIPKGG